MMVGIGDELGIEFNVGDLLVVCDLISDVEFMIFVVLCMVWGLWVVSW